MNKIINKLMSENGERRLRVCSKAFQERYRGDDSMRTIFEQSVRELVIAELEDLAKQRRKKRDDNLLLRKCRDGKGKKTRGRARDRSKRPSKRDALV